MTPNHRVIRLVVAFAVGLAVAYGSYQWISDSERPARRAQEEAVALAARDILRSYITVENLQISDAIDRVRDAGKVYLFPTDDGWELSGHYKRPDERKWHAWLMALDDNVGLVSLAVQDTDAELTNLADSDPKFTTSE
jgi:hypothetical protein